MCLRERLYPLSNTGHLRSLSFLCTCGLLALTSHARTVVPVCSPGAPKAGGVSLKRRRHAEASVFDELFSSIRRDKEEAAGTLLPCTRVNLTPMQSIPPVSDAVTSVISCLHHSVGRLLHTLLLSSSPSPVPLSPHLLLTSPSHLSSSPSLHLQPVKMRTLLHQH